MERRGSGVRAGRFALGKDEALAKVFLTALRSLPKADRDHVLMGLVGDRRLRRDLVDLAVMEERKTKPSRPFREYLRERSEGCWEADGRYPSRSEAIEAAVRVKLERLCRRRLAEEAAKLDPKEERALAEEGM